MSELKSYIAPTADGTGLADYYLKSEADKVIAELKEDYKEACDRLQTANLIKDEQLAATRHQKRKRCLAMADRCHERFLHYVLLVCFGPNEGAIPFYERRRDRAYKWMYKWLELAKKFKPNKEA